MSKLIDKIKSDKVLILSGMAAIITMFFVTPSTEYLAYIDYRVLALLFCLMCAVAGLGKEGVFIRISQWLTGKCSSIKGLSLILVLLCFFSSMLITNDVALITFVPFAAVILAKAPHKQLIFVIVMQTVAANLGSMLTPVGNPQNLYLYSYFGLDISTFMGIVLPMGTISLVVILAIMLVYKNGDNTSKTIENNSNMAYDARKIVMYCLVFMLAILTVFDIVNFWVTLAFTLVVIYFTDKDILHRVDYALLATFVCFFVFVGNMGRIPEVRNLLMQAIESRELLAAALLSQIISNVPTALMLSGFTDNYKALILGTNIGGLGTLVGSLASLISFKLYSKLPQAEPKRYLFVFTIINVALLAVFLGINLI